jgi:hypothetical protein
MSFNNMTLKRQFSVWVLCRCKTSDIAHCSGGINKCFLCITQKSQWWQSPRSEPHRRRRWWREGLDSQRSFQHSPPLSRTTHSLTSIWFRRLGGSSLPAPLPCLVVGHQRTNVDALLLFFTLLLSQTNSNTKNQLQCLPPSPFTPRSSGPSARRRPTLRR